MNKKKRKKPKSRFYAEQRARSISTTLLDWLPKGLASQPKEAQKVACVVWYDKISNYITSDSVIRQVVRDTPFDIDYDKNKVVDILVSVFDYKPEFAVWRINGRSIS